MDTRVNVELYDETGTSLHAKGQIEFNNIADAAIVERNGHTYVYQVTSRVNVCIFHETRTPYCIMEF